MLEWGEFEDAEDAREKGEWFRREDNAVRPHSSIDDKTPKEFAAECDAGRHGQPPQESIEAARVSRSPADKPLARSAIADLDPDGRE